MSRWPVSKVYLLVITSLPTVVAETIAVAVEDSPVIVSEVLNVLLFVETKLTGLDVEIILPVAPEAEPVIFSPLVNVPVIVPIVKVGAAASVDTSSESNTAAKLNTSARPNEIVLSVGLVPNASVAPVVTLTSFIRLVVLVLCDTEVLRIVANNLTFAESPKIVSSVTVSNGEPVPVTFPEILTTSP